VSAADDSPRLAALAALGLSANATPRDIVSAYRRMARSSHPDTSDAGGDSAQFARISDAYQYLSRNSGYLPPPVVFDSLEGPPQPSSSPPVSSPDSLSSVDWRGEAPPVIAGPVIIRPLPPESR
jgi:hypothetical protein